ncbi:gamma-glutamyltransferase [Chondromyces apiculatus]|nr:gamma-glutamyltransferase [Chondromyces apiculatus]
MTDPDPVPPTEFVPTARGRGGAAATVDVRGTWAAIETLSHGGNAVDAAVAAAAVLGVTDPFSCGIGGGGFMLVYLAETKQAVVIDHREVAPQAMDRTAFYDAQGAPLSFDTLLTSGLSVGVPGTLRGWEEALQRYGTLPLADTLRLAILVAENGLDVDQTFFDQTTRNLERFRQIESSRALFLTAEGDPLPVGSTFKNPDLAATYRAIAEGGPAAFYQDEIADAIVATVKNPPFIAGSTIVSRPGLMEKSDLSGYEARVRPAVTSTYRGHTLFGVGLPSSGGLTGAMAMNLLGGFDLPAMSQSDALHHYLEASRLAYADRNAFMGDPEFVNVPVAGMLSAGYADERRLLIDPALASVAAAMPGDPFAYQNDPSGVWAGAGWSVSAGMGAGVDIDVSGDAPGDLDPETTHLTITDAAGNVVSYTCTIEYEGGNGMVVPGHGFLLNNELTDFNIPPTTNDVHPNVLEPGKRPRSSMSPVIVLKDDKPVLAAGAPGGATIITTVLQILVNHLDLGMPIEDAVAAPRVSQRNSGNATSNAEPAFLGSAEAMALEALGHQFADAGLIGAATAIQFHADGSVTAAAEPVRRNGGSAMVVEAE